MGETVLRKGALQVRSERDGDAHRVRALGELDLASVELLDEEMRRVERSDAPRIVLDLSGLDFLDSTGIHLLLKLSRRSRENGGRLELLRGRGQVEQLLALTCVDRVLPLAD